MTLAARVGIACASVMSVGMVVAGFVMRAAIYRSLDPFAQHFLMMRQMMGSGPDLQRIFLVVDRAMWLSTIVAVVIGCLISLLIGLDLSRSVVTLRRGLDRFADGRLTETIDARGPAEIQAIAESANRMARQLHRAQEAERELVAGVAHDLAHPMTAMRGTLEAIGDGLIDASDARTIRRLLADLVTLEEILADLRDVAAVEAGRIRLSFDDLDVERVAASIRDAYVDLAARKGIALEFAGSGCTLARTDERRLQRTVANLVVNALQATSPGGRVRVGTRADGGYAVVFVEDSAGAEAAARIRSALEDGAGSGLGLRVVSVLSSALRAKVDVRQSEAGAVVEIWLAMPPLRTDGATSRRHDQHVAGPTQ
ncbi:MAG: HAMP domain-containing histidine kinase [bacterium]|nr:HAMP domain-containing histidine kinase [bacterium]